MHERKSSCKARLDTTSQTWYIFCRATQPSLLDSPRLPSSGSPYHAISPRSLPHERRSWSSPCGLVGTRGADTNGIASRTNCPLGPPRKLSNPVLHHLPSQCSHPIRPWRLSFMCVNPDCIFFPTSPHCQTSASWHSLTQSHCSHSAVAKSAYPARASSILLFCPPLGHLDSHRNNPHLLRTCPGALMPCRRWVLWLGN